MKKTLMVLALICSSGVSLHSETPTVQQCRMDEQAWRSGELQTGIKSLSFTEIGARKTEMMGCWMNYKETDFLVKESDYDGEIIGRMTLFIQRHNLGEQFKQENGIQK